MAPDAKPSAGTGYPVHISDNKWIKIHHLQNRSWLYTFTRVSLFSVTKSRFEWVVLGCEILIFASHVYGCTFSTHKFIYIYNIYIVTCENVPGIWPAVSEPTTLLNAWNKKQFACFVWSLPWNIQKRMQHFYIFFQATWNFGHHKFS